MGVTGIEPVNHMGTVLQTVAFTIFATLPKPAGVDKEHHAGRIIYAKDYAIHFNFMPLLATEAAGFEPAKVYKRTLPI